MESPQALGRSREGVSAAEGQWAEDRDHDA